ncbi:carbohydrate ABC transporter permease [Paenibacillus sepulcri]|uniref:Carbohydrate ABC transporter permease n=2 Tax=Paenibacillus sepulcri TaxID=359917 RepID=A0ABS7BY27_9BACL|nr:carbohydrate ABC transporter permease [Paenibacillus sepulcri]
MLILVVLSVIFLFPLYFSFISAFKTNGQILNDSMKLPTSLYLDNFRFLFQETKFVQAIFNTTYLTITSIIGMILVIPMAAYALERKESRLSNLLYLYFLMGLMIPFQIYMVPLFREINWLGLYGYLSSPIIIYVAGSISFGILLYTSFLKGVPREIEEAAQIDGASRMGIFWRIVFPLLAPCTATLIVLNGIGIWNDFLLPLLMLPGNGAKTINVEIFSFVDQFASRWDIVFAGTVCAILPLIVVFVFLQQYFVKGISSGATKG